MKGSGRTAVFMLAACSSPALARTCPSQIGTYALTMQLEPSSGCAGPTSSVTIQITASEVVILGAPSTTVVETDGKPITRGPPMSCVLSGLVCGTQVRIGCNDSGESGCDSESFILNIDTQDNVSGTATYLCGLCHWSILGHRL